MITWHIFAYFLALMYDNPAHRSKFKHEGKFHIKCLVSRHIGILIPFY